MSASNYLSMPRFLFLVLCSYFIFFPLGLRSAPPLKSPPTIESDEEVDREAGEDAQEIAERLKESAEREKAYAEAVKVQEARKKKYEGLTDEERKKVRERESRLPQPEDGYSWRNQADAYHLTASDKERLETQKFVVGSTEFRQSFEPYHQPKVPVFITSDSLLNVFHVLFEDSFRELEIRRALQLKGYLEEMMTRARRVVAKLPYSTDEYGPSVRHAQQALGPAMRLLGTSIEFFDASERKGIESEVALIREANGIRLPAWLEPATDDFLAIDYGRFKPVGFYVGSRLLEDYFRAVRWLQIVPFRIERDSELGAIAILGSDLPKSKTYPYESYLLQYANFLGRPDGRYLSDRINILSDSGTPSRVRSFHERLDEARTWLKPHREELIGNLHAPNATAAYGHPAPFRLLADYALPESVVFQKLIDDKKNITGLQFAALNGSSWAFSQLDGSQKGEVLDNKIKEFKERDSDFGPSQYLYPRYLDVVSSLFEKPDRDAPAFMGSDAWAAKSCQTALASWTQMRHTFTLQTRISISATCAFDRTPGFIEPNPSFLRAYVNLVHTAQRVLDEFGVFEPSSAVVAEGFLEDADLCDRYVTLSKELKKRKFRETVVYQKVHEIFQYGRLNELPDDADSTAIIQSLIEAEGADRLEDALPRYAQYLRKIATEYLEGRLSFKPSLEETRLIARWQRLDRLASRLEVLLQKQLRGLNWEKEEAEYIRDYGGVMAYIMGYFGNVYSPDDDSPRWVEIADFPNRGTLFAVATGRPREFYVLYPWKGIEILCVGSVIPYFEYEGAKHLTDAEWTQTLGTERAPEIPNWAKLLYLDSRVKSVRLE